MALIAPDSVVSESTLRELRTEFLEALTEELDRLTTPNRRVTDAPRLERARELARSFVAAYEAAPPSDRGRLIREVNLGYATMLAVIDLMKGSLDLPFVPRPSA